MLRHNNTVFAASTGMVGVCLTAIGLILVVEHLSSVRTMSRVVLGVTSFVFLVTALLSFFAMKAHVRGQRSPMEAAADVTMLLGLLGSVLACVTLVFTLL
jgi:hypothetical protein